MMLFDSEENSRQYWSLVFYCVKMVFVDVFVILLVLVDMGIEDFVLEIVIGVQKKEEMYVYNVWFFCFMVEEVKEEFQRFYKLVVVMSEEMLCLDSLVVCFAILEWVFVINLYVFLFFNYF